MFIYLFKLKCMLHGIFMQSVHCKMCCAVRTQYKKIHFIIIPSLWTGLEYVHSFFSCRMRRLKGCHEDRASSRQQTPRNICTRYRSKHVADTLMCLVLESSCYRTFSATQITHIFTASFNLLISGTREDMGCGRTKMTLMKLFCKLKFITVKSNMLVYL